MTEISCMRCGSAHVRRSRRRNATEKGVAVLGGRLRRCHDCNSRFVQLGGMLIQMNDLHRGIKKLKIALVMAIAAIVVIVAILWFARLQPAGTGDAGAQFREMPAVGALHDALS